MQMKVNVTSTIDPLKFAKVLQERKKTFFSAAMAVVVDDIIGGINAGVDMTGKPLPSLEPETVRRKGHDSPLIDTGLLIQDYSYEKLNKSLINAAEISIKPRKRSNETTTRDISSAILQVDGITTKSGYKQFIFFGVSQNASDKINDLIAEIVDEAIEAV